MTNDTGPMHMANALRVPVVAVFGPTEPAVTAPFTAAVAGPQRRRSLLALPLPRVPLDHRCLALVAPAEVAAAAEALWP